MVELAVREVERALGAYVRVVFVDGDIDVWKESRLPQISGESVQQQLLPAEEPTATCEKSGP